jgi:hypothetical protein
MAAPDTRSSTLRFCWRPAEVSFEATGRVLPKPLAAANLSFVHEGSSALAAIVVGGGPTLCTTSMLALTGQQCLVRERLVLVVVRRSDAPKRPPITATIEPKMIKSS